ASAEQQFPILGCPGGIALIGQLPSDRAIERPRGPFDRQIARCDPRDLVAGEGRFQAGAVDDRIVPDQRRTFPFPAANRVEIEFDHVATVVARESREVYSLQRKLLLAENGCGDFAWLRIGLFRPSACREQQRPCESGCRARHAARTSVPAPVDVKNSSSIACPTRPSRTTAASQPAATACRQVSSLGIMPPLIVPSALSRTISGGVRSVSRRPSLSSTPGTSVSRNSLAAPSAAAIAPAM